MRTFRQLLEELSKSSVNNIGRSREQLLKRVNAEGLGEHPSGDNINHLSDLIRDAPDHHQAWIIPRYAKGKIGHTEDIGQILDNLKTHDDLKERELIHPRTLSKLGYGSDLHGLIRKLTDPNTLNVARTAEFSFDPKQFTVTGENKDWTIVTPHTLDAAIHFGRDTSWCTANKCSSHNHYESYTDAPLHTLIPKNPRHKGERYQLYLDPTGSKTQLKDHENRSVDINSIFNGIIGHGRGNAVTKPLPGIFHYLHQIKTDPKVLTDAIIRGDRQHVAAADPSSLDFSKTDPDRLISSNDLFAHKTLINYHPEHVPALMQLMGKDLHSDARHYIDRNHPMIQKESAIRRYRNILREVTIHGIDSDNVTDADVGTFTPYPSSPTSQFKVDYDSIIPGDSSPIKIKSIFRHFNGVVCPEFTVQGDHTRNPNMSQSLPVNISIYQTLLKHFMHHINTTRSIGMEAVRVSYGTTDSGKDKLYGHISSALGLPSVNGLTPIQRTRETRANQEKFHADQEKIRPY